MEGIEHEFEKMRGYLLKSTTHRLRNYWKNGTMGKKDFRQHSSWEGRQNMIRWENLNEGHDTPVEWISKRRNMIFTKMGWWVKRATSQCLRNERIEVESLERKELRRKWHLLPQMSLKGILRRRVERNCWKTNNEKRKLVLGLWKTSQNWGQILPLTETID